jgi:hypothetical protein
MFDPASTYQQSFQNRDTIDHTQLMNPQWARWLDLIKEQAGGDSIKLAGGPSEPNSNQLLGESVQPSLQGLNAAIHTPTTVTPTSYTPTLENPTPAQDPVQQGLAKLSTDDVINRRRASRKAAQGQV